MLPVVAIVGRPNVGKSTLFNRLTKSRDALVFDTPGVTRDRQYGEATLNKRKFILIDTGGLTDEKEGIDPHMVAQTRLAIEEADLILFMVDAQTGLSAQDEVTARYLRQQNTPLHVVLNKVDGSNPDIVSADFFQLGLGNPHPIAAAHGRGIQKLGQIISACFPENIVDVSEPSRDKETLGIKVAIVGRPNVGKSTLVNRILGEERVVVFDQAGTTRDSIYITFERHEDKYTIIDTAGVRRRSRIDDVLEKFSVVKALQAISDSDVVVMLVDGQQELATQDLTLLSYIIDAGKALVIAVNKWDKLAQEQREFIRKEIDRRLSFTQFAKKHFISALHGSGVGDLFRSINKAYACASQSLSTPKLTRMLEDAVEKYQPPLSHGRRIKLRYAHAGAKQPPTIIIHGTQAEMIPTAYKRYLMNYFIKALKIEGTPMRINFKSTVNPFADKKNKLTLGQERRRKEMIKFHKKKKK